MCTPNTRMTKNAATIESVYWPRLKRALQKGLRATESWTIEAAPWAMIAGPRPPARSRAIENEVERTISPSLSRRGILTGSISPIITPAASTANVYP